MSIRRVSRGPRLAILACSVLALVSGATAQDVRGEPPSTPNAAASQPPVFPGSQRPGARGNAVTAAAPGETRRLPEDSTTKQTVTVNGRTLSFTATAGSLRLFNGKGDPRADIAYTAYNLDGADPRTRPVTFFFNGGPGAASAYLQLGCAGPWRLSIEGDAG